MNQKERATSGVAAAVKRLKAALEESKKDIEDADMAIGEAQNPPPLGVADGSITQREWFELNGTMSAIKNVLYYVESIK